MVSAPPQRLCKAIINPGLYYTGMAVSVALGYELRSVEACWSLGQPNHRSAYLLVLLTRMCV